MIRERFSVFRAVLAAFLLLAVAFLAVAAPVQAQSREPKPLRFEQAFSEGPVYVVPIQGMIDNGLARYIDRALATTGPR